MKFRLTGVAIAFLALLVPSAAWALDGWTLILYGNGNPDYHLCVSGDLVPPLRDLNRCAASIAAQDPAAKGKAYNSERHGFGLERSECDNHFSVNAAALEHAGCVQNVGNPQPSACPPAYNGNSFDWGMLLNGQVTCYYAANTSFTTKAAPKKFSFWRPERGGYSCRHDVQFSCNYW